MSFHERMNSQEMRLADQLAFSMRMITEIPVTYNATIDSGQSLQAVSMIDAFYVHLRLLGDFLVKPTKRFDIGPNDFGVIWTIPTSEAAARLSNYWQVASKYVVHFGQARVPEQLVDLQSFEVNAQSMASMAEDALTVLASFIGTVEANAATSQSTTLVSERVRLLADRAAYLRGEFDRACHRLNIDPASLGSGTSN
jgi:hypothetical protein